MPLRGATFGLLGALSAFPRRLAAREVERIGGTLHRRLTRQTRMAVYGRSLLQRSPAEVEALFDLTERRGQIALSETAFLVELGLVRRGFNDFTEKVILEQSGLSRRDLRMLSLFDAFEGHFSFRDLVRAKTYSKLISDGSDWRAIAASVHGSGALAKLPQLSVRAQAGRIYALRDGILTELDGQTLLPLNVEQRDDSDLLFASAEELERAGDYVRAADIYERCLTLDPRDSIAAFNRANCLRAAGDFKGSAAAYALAIKLDRRLSEAWFNFAGLLREHGKMDGARHHLREALKVDPNYADAIYDLAALEYEAGAFQAARKYWVSYLKLDQQSDWARNAERGIHFVDTELSRAAKR